jgi:adenylate cyclase
MFTSFAGVIFQLVNEERVNQNSVLVGLPLGLVFGLLELFLFPKASKRFRQWSFSMLLVFKALLYTGAIFIVSVVLIIIAGLREGRQFSELPTYFASIQQVTLIIYALVIYSLLIFFLQINLLLGQGVLWKFVSGRYHKPREEERIFMFLDMKSSTTIAERFGHVRFYRLLNELFHEISQPVLQTKAEIYQYVGDEVVLTWPVAQGFEEFNCIRCFFLFRGNLERHSDNYMKEFGVRPQIKAGLHFGKVICAQIGDLKREIVYNGDVLNTTARIQSECNTYQRDCLVSGQLIKRLGESNEFTWDKIGSVTLRGKESEVDLFSVKENDINISNQQRH